MSGLQRKIKVIEVGECLLNSPVSIIRGQNHRCQICELIKQETARFDSSDDEYEALFICPHCLLDIIRRIIIVD